MGVWFKPWTWKLLDLERWQQLKAHPFRDHAFSKADWERHVTWRRYIPEIQVSAVVVVTLLPLITWSVFVSACVGLYATFLVPHGWPEVTNHPDFIVPFTITSFALSLLLLYKTNSAYQRWWEARTQLGTLYIVSRSITRLNLAWVGRTDPRLAAALNRWTASIMPSLCAFIREDDRYYGYCKGVLMQTELEWLRARRIPPIAAQQVMSQILVQARLGEFERVQIETLINQCDTCVGACERIVRTAMPLAYNRHSHRFLLTYISFLPFALWPLYDWVTLPVMAVLSFLLLGVENIGIQIEEPLSVLPLDQICAATLRAVSAMSADEQSVQSMAAASAQVPVPAPEDGPRAAEAAEAAVAQRGERRPAQAPPGGAVAMDVG